MARFSDFKNSPAFENMRLWTRRALFLSAVSCLLLAARMSVEFIVIANIAMLISWNVEFVKPE